MVQFTVATPDKITLIREIRSEFGWGLKESRDAVEQGVVFNDSPEGRSAALAFIGRATKFYDCDFTNFSIRVRRYEPPLRENQPVYMKENTINVPTYFNLG